MEPTSPSSGGLFFSSSPTQTSPGPAEEASILVAQALQDNQVDQVLEDIVLENSHTFFEIFHRRVQLIKSRSQAFQDCHVTVFDKALLELTQNGNDLRNASAVSFFCEEHLGIPVSAEFIHKEEFLPNILFVPKTVNQVSSPPPTQRGSISTRAPGSRSPEKRHLIKSSMEEQKPAILASLASKIDAPSLRLWSVFQRAKDEFYSIQEANSVSKQESAKFLRDTAENTLYHLTDKNPDQRLIDELESTLEVAMHIAMTLHGGKKRKFDDAAFSSSRSGFPAVRYSRPKRIETTNESARHERPRRMKEGRHLDELFSEDTQNTSYRTRRLDDDLFRNRPRFVAPELSPKDVKGSRQKKKQPGRGHSGIPFGYSRQVDSYHPAREL